MPNYIKLGKEYSFDGTVVVKSKNSELECKLVIPDYMNEDEFRNIMTKDNLSYIIEVSNDVETPYAGYIGSIKIEINGRAATISLTRVSLDDVINDFYRMVYTSKMDGTEQDNLRRGIISHINTDLMEVIVRQLGGK